MKEELKKPEYSKLKLVDVVYGDDDDTKSYNEAQALFKKYPNLKVIIAPTTVGIAASARAVTDTNLIGKVSSPASVPPTRCVNTSRTAPPRSSPCGILATLATCPPTCLRAGHWRDHGRGRRQVHGRPPGEYTVRKTLTWVPTFYSACRSSTTPTTSTTSTGNPPG